MPEHIGVATDRNQHLFPDDSIHCWWNRFGILVEPHRGSEFELNVARRSSDRLEPVAELRVEASAFLETIHSLNSIYSEAFFTALRNLLEPREIIYPAFDERPAQALWHELLSKSKMDIPDLLLRPRS